MKLNPDCIREILLEIEEHTGYNRMLCLENPDTAALLGDEPPERINPLIEKYGADQVFYHLNYCEKAFLIEETVVYAGGTTCVSDLTPAGHEFLSNIRNDNNWNTVKDTAQQVGSFSLDTLKSIATTTISTLVAAQFK